jgi:hypothetical protein
VNHVEKAQKHFDDGKYEAALRELSYVDAHVRNGDLRAAQDLVGQAFLIREQAGGELAAQCDELIAHTEKVFDEHGLVIASDGPQLALNKLRRLLSDAGHRVFMAEVSFTTYSTHASFDPTALLRRFRRKQERQAFEVLLEAVREMRRVGAYVIQMCAALEIDPDELAEIEPGIPTVIESVTDYFGAESNEQVWAILMQHSSRRPT